MLNKASPCQIILTCVNERNLKKTNPEPLNENFPNYLLNKC
jgi:hypothetical protein